MLVLLSSDQVNQTNTSQPPHLCMHMPHGEDIATRILHECNHLIVVNKMAGELVQGDRTGDHTLGDLIKEYIRVKYNKPGEAFLGVIHRIDRPTSGAVVFAKTSKALSRMNEVFRKREVKKTYWAVASKAPAKKQDSLVHYIRKDAERNKAVIYHKPSTDAKEARLKYQIVAEKNGRSLLEVELESGRAHQIRAQLAAIGCPLIGDLKYGASKALPDKSIALHARMLSFKHPTREEQIEVEAATPRIAPWTLFE